MAIQDELQIMSFRGVPFYWLSITTSGGRKVVSHEFVLKNSRFSEDLGLLDKSFSVKATISSNNYKQNVQTLITALEKQGSATLVIPTMSSYECQVINWTLDETISDIGYADFTINFEKTERNVFPIQAVGNASKILNKSQNLFSKIQSNISNTYKSVANKFQAFNTIKQKMQDFGNKINSVANKFRQVQANINSFSSSINNFIQDINSLIVAPSQLAASIYNLTAQLQVLFEYPEDVFNFFEGMFDFGDDDSPVQNLNDERILINENRDVLNSNLQTMALVGAYQSIIDIDFLTIDDLQSFKNKLENQYNKLVSSETIDYETKELLQDLRNESNTYFEQQKQVALNIESINIYNEPITALTYRLYGNLDNVDYLIDANKVENYSFINQDFNILTD